jgi:hypothetical protein
MMPNALPESARQRLSALQVARIGADELGRSLNARLNALGSNPDRELQSGLTSERDRRFEQHRQLALLINRLNQWIMQLPAGTALEPMAISNVELKDSETLQQALDRLRAEIQALSHHLSAVKMAPLPRADQIKAAEVFVAKMASAARPTAVSVVKDNTLRLAWRDDVIAGVGDALALLCWATPEAVLAALAREIDAQPTRVDAMPAAERLARVAELEAQLLELETVEECLVGKMHAQGLVDTMRRVDIANLGVVLGVMVARKAQASAVA